VQYPENQESSMTAAMVTAVEMAKEAGVNPKVFQAALRKQHFRWHLRDARWTVEKDSLEHEEMRRVLQSLIDRRMRSTFSSADE
jgi:hypothetical protein